MKTIQGVPAYGACEPNFEALRLALNRMGESYSAAYFHGIAGTAFRIGGICPCAPTCTSAMGTRELAELLGYECDEIPDGQPDSAAQMIKAVRASIDRGVPALVWNAFTACEWDVVTGYDEGAEKFFGRGSYAGNGDDYANAAWDNAKNAGASAGVMALIITGKTGELNRAKAEAAAIAEAARHASDPENVDKLDGGEWVFLQGKAAYNRWALDFAKPETPRGLGDAYCVGIYSSCHALAGTFLREIAPRHPNAAGQLNKAAALFDEEADCLRKLVPLLGWGSPSGPDAARNEKAQPLLAAASARYAEAAEALACAASHMNNEG